jgi:hypothetical protein
VSNKEKEAIAAYMLYLPDNVSMSAGHYCSGNKANFRNKGVMSFFSQEMVRLARDKGFKKSVAQCYN